MNGPVGATLPLVYAREETDESNKSVRSRPSNTIRKLCTYLEHQAR